MFQAHVLFVRRAKLCDYYVLLNYTITTPKKFYYHVLILIELYFNNFNYFSNFRPLTCFSVIIPEAA